jgi:hypothetical protein
MVRKRNVSNSRNGRLGQGCEEDDLKKRVQLPEEQIRQRYSITEAAKATL